MSLLSVFQALEATAAGEAIRGSLWAFPVIEAVHLLGLALLGGAALMVDMRLLGLGLRSQPSSQLYQDANRWVVLGLVLLLPTGFLLFVSEATKCYYNVAFWVKMVSLLLAVIFTFTIKKRTALADLGPTSAWNKAVGVASIVLWSGVGGGGRWIGFS